MEDDKSDIKWIWEMPKDLDRKFRIAIVKKKGLHRGVIKESLEEAVKDWIKKPKVKQNA